MMSTKRSNYSEVAQLVEHPAVNRQVAGSSPAFGAIWPVGQVVKTPPFHGGNTGSNPVRVTTYILIMMIYLWSRGVAVNMPACHAGDRRFDPGRDRHFWGIAKR